MTRFGIIAPSYETLDLFEDVWYLKENYGFWANLALLILVVLMIPLFYYLKTDNSSKKYERSQSAYLNSYSFYFFFIIYIFFRRNNRSEYSERTFSRKTPLLTTKLTLTKKFKLIRKRRKKILLTNRKKG